jgi:Spy/CpxP family protein refolding chaperone
MFRVIAAPAFALVTLGVAAASLAADPKPPPPQAPSAAPSRGPASALELTDAQRRQVETLRSESERQLAPLREQLAARRKELSALWSAEKPDRAALLKKEAELEGVRQKMRQVALDQRLAYLGLLTPEQRAAWRAHPGRGGTGMMGPGMGGPGMHGAGMHGSGMHGAGMHGAGMHGAGNAPRRAMTSVELMGSDECLGYLGCDAPCEQALPPAPAAKPAGPTPSSR